MAFRIAYIAQPQGWGAARGHNACGSGLCRRKQHNLRSVPRATNLLWTLELLNSKRVLDFAVAILASSIAGLGNEDRASFTFVRELSAAALRRHRTRCLLSDRRTGTPRS